MAVRILLIISDTVYADGSISRVLSSSSPDTIPPTPDFKKPSLLRRRTQKLTKPFKEESSRQKTTLSVEKLEEEEGTYPFLLSFNP